MKSEKYDENSYETKIGIEFEEHVGKLLEKQRWKIDYHGIREGKKDKGIDLIATRNGITALIQCKYKGDPESKINDEPIDKLYASGTEYKIIHNVPSHKIELIVITTGDFFPDTREKARHLGVELIDRQLDIKFIPKTKQSEIKKSLQESLKEETNSEQSANSGKIKEVNFQTKAGT